MIAAAGCSTVIGPPDSENGMDHPPDFEAQSSQYDLFFEGQPTPASFHAEGGYYVWRIGNTWHVRVAKSDRFRFDTTMTPVFSGQISISKGVISGLTRRLVDVQNKVRQGQDIIDFRFRLRNDVEGFDFSVKPFGLRYCVTFDMRIDNASDPSIMHLGRSMFKPDVMPVTSCVP